MNHAFYFLSFILIFGGCSHTKTTLAPIKQKPKKLVQKQSVKPKLQCNNKKLNLKENSLGICIGSLGFKKAKVSKRTSDMSVLSATTTYSLIKTSNPSCKTLFYTQSRMNKFHPQMVFESSFKKQLQNKFEQCKVSSKKNWNAIECQNKNKSVYFIEQSVQTAEGILNKYLLQMNKTCFEKTLKRKAIFQTKQTIPWLKLPSHATNMIFNRDFYTQILYKRLDNRFYLVGQKIFGSMYKPYKIEEYYFYSLSLDTTAKPLFLNKNLVFDKKIVRNFDQNGVDQHGFDVHGWNDELKKFRNRL